MPVPKIKQRLTEISHTHNKHLRHFLPYGKTYFQPLFPVFLARLLSEYLPKEPAMPELPEVENIAQGLRNEITGLSITKLYISKPLILKGPHRRRHRRIAAELTGAKITLVTRRAKRLILFTNSSYHLILQLGMTGRFCLAHPQTPRNPHTHIVINLSDKRQLQFIDPRRFGRLWFVQHLSVNDPDQAMLDAGMSKLGPEADQISAAQFLQLLNSKRVIKTLLLDQTRIAGLGNIYADEALHRAGIHPATRACDINSSKNKTLRLAIRRVLGSAIRAGGTTFSDFRNAYGDMGSFLKHLRVYQRTGTPCKKCGTPIARIVLVGRSSHFCPNCQTKP